MYTGNANPNASAPLQKMKITNKDKSQEINVLYNPQSYKVSSSVKYARKSPVGSDAPIIQFLNGEGDTLYFELFFDSLYAGEEVGGSDKDKFSGNSRKSSQNNTIDIRDYTSKVYNLTKIEKSVHRPPLLKVEWGKLQFEGYLSQCEQEFTKFNEKGMAVRATLKCTFFRSVKMDNLFGGEPLESPDTTKYRRLKEGDSLWAMASAEYGDSGKWRAIADANGLANPRLLHTGDMVRVPALQL